MSAIERLEPSDSEANTMGCRCPEVDSGNTWVPFCEAWPLPEALSAPQCWRCPDCKRGILRIGVQKSDELPEGFRIDFRCSSQTCGWNEYILTEQEGLLSATELDHFRP